jgi:hypothetical protein
MTRDEQKIFNLLSYLHQNPFEQMMIRRSVSHAGTARLAIPEQPIRPS